MMVKAGLTEIQKVLAVEKKAKKEKNIQLADQL